ncbi:MAG: ribonuclease P protein component [Pelagibacterales bacterium]|mgnify:CR=1 FL=1|nr:ribonuclease P protein component [Pelagibacterales bacterium]|tara:strand:- start:2091 stop:2435 length:345 start_codon:yes stop_codon:yes gene_type:complete
MLNLLPTIKNRKDFLDITKNGLLSPQYGLVLQCKINNEHDIRIGITATKKIGNAVTRNRCKRKLRTVANDILKNFAHKNNDYVLIARNTTYDRDINLLKEDLIKALKKIKKYKN